MKDFIGLAITVAIGVLLVVMSLILISGRGSSLIAGYNTSPVNEKEKYDDKALGKFIGKIIMPIGICVPVIAIGGIYEMTWLPVAYGVLVILLTIFALVYCNTGNRFRK